MVSAPLLELKVTVPEGVEVGLLSVSATVTTKFEPCPIAVVAVSGLMVVEVARAFTVTDAVLLVAPGPLSVEVIAPVVLFLVPVVVLVTFSEIAHEPLAATVPADKLIEPEPAPATVVPLHVLLRLLGFATTSPAGKLSEKAKPVRPIVFEFAILNVRLVLAFSGSDAAPKDFAMDGGVATVTLADAVFPDPPFVELTAPVVLFFTPEVVAFTLTERVHELLAGTVPAVRLTLALPAVAVAVPPHVLVKPFSVATTSPAGNVSVNATPASATVLTAGLVIVNVRLVVPFTGMAVAPNALPILGGATTDSICWGEAVPADAVRVGAPALGSL
jgi:hypothetical protein